MGFEGLRAVLLSFPVSSFSEIVKEIMTLMVILLGHYFLSSLLVFWSWLHFCFECVVLNFPPWVLCAMSRLRWQGVVLDLVFLTLIPSTSW